MHQLRAAAVLNLQFTYFQKPALVAYMWEYVSKISLIYMCDTYLPHPFICDKHVRRILSYV